MKLDTICDTVPRIFSFRKRHQKYERIKDLLLLFSSHLLSLLLAYLLRVRSRTVSRRLLTDHHHNNMIMMNIAKVAAATKPIVRQAARSVARQALATQMLPRAAWYSTSTFRPSNMDDLKVRSCFVHVLYWLVGRVF